MADHAVRRPIGDVIGSARRTDRSRWLHRLTARLGLRVVNPLWFITVLTGANGAVVPRWQFVQAVELVGIWLGGLISPWLKLVVDVWHWEQSPVVG